MSKFGVLFCFYISGDFREKYGLSRSLSAGFQAGLAALRRQPELAPFPSRAAPGLCPVGSALWASAQYASVLGSAQHSSGSVQPV